MLFSLKACISVRAPQAEAEEQEAGDMGKGWGRGWALHGQDEATWCGWKGSAWSSCAVL